MQEKEDETGFRLIRILILVRFFFSCCSTISRYTALTNHNEQLQASTFGEQYNNSDLFEDFNTGMLEGLSSVVILTNLLFSDLK